MDDTSYRFSRRVDNYIKYRPHYPQALLDLLRTECQLTPDSVIADLGSGTGILTELFLANGNRVFGIEPDSDMRAGAEHQLRAFPQFTSVAATAEATALPDHSVDLVTAGQAFHWFNHDRARPEFARILSPEGWVVLVWNGHRVTGTPFVVALDQFWRKHFPTFTVTPMRKGPADAGTGAGGSEFVTGVIQPFFGSCGFKETLFDNPLVCDFEGLKGRALSGRIAPEEGDPRYRALLEGLEEIFRGHQENGKVTIEQDTRVVYGRVPGGE